MLLNPTPIAPVVLMCRGNAAHRCIQHHEQTCKYRSNYPLDKLWIDVRLLKSLTVAIIRMIFIMDILNIDSQNDKNSYNTCSKNGNNNHSYI